MKKRLTKVELEEELQSLKNGDQIEREEFKDICGSERVHPSPCCAPEYCALAPFHEISIARKALQIMKRYKGVPTIREAMRRAEKSVLAKRGKTRKNILDGPRGKR
jgi:hypothetical protein